MSYNFTQDDIGKLLSRFSSENNYTLTFPDNIGSISSQKKIINDDILFFKSKVLTSNNIKIQSNQKMNGIYVGILLDGTVTYNDNILNKSIILKKNETKISYINEFDITTIFNHSSNGIGLFIEKNFIEKNFSEILDLNSKNIQKESSTTLKCKNSNNIHLAKELFTSPFHGGLHDVYMQSKILEIIYNEFNELTFHKQSTKDKKVKITKEDIEALYKAREIILQNKDFLTVLNLSKKVAINEFKLKYGFKKLFNTTPGNMILEQKMIHAKELIEKSEFSISEISNFVGYKYQQSFTNAFIRYFNIRPKDIMKRRKYYY
ncbi:helix-turn-helix domain-containing protein [Arcobacter sp.]|uniref:helix-turn-helix domain-containing protein n=1 Tax=unclassified Arcobacter TaxID=2593671 RepID=UPI003AFFCBE4